MEERLAAMQARLDEQSRPLQEGEGVERAFRRGDSAEAGK